MSIALATSARVIVPGVPPNWSQWRGSSIQRDVQKKPWRDLAWFVAQSERNRVHWPLPVKTDPPARRYLEVAIHKLRPHYDDDGCVSCLKPLIDGMKGVLVWDDSPACLGLLTPPCDMQQVASSESTQRVILTVHLVDPR